MKYAISSGQRIQPTKGAIGNCPCCGKELIAKCGEIKRHHWAHKRKCDDHWWENETDWHRDWKNQFPEEWQEVVHIDDAGEKHIADVKTDDGWAVEFQHSYLKSEERRSRNLFYKKIVWVVDGKRRKRDVKQFEELLDRMNHQRVAEKPVIISPYWSDENRLITEWESMDTTTFLDYGFVDSENRQVLWMMFPSPIENEVYLRPMLKQKVVEMIRGGKLDEWHNGFVNPVVAELNRLHLEKAKQNDLFFPRGGRSHQLKRY